VLGWTSSGKGRADSDDPMSCLSLWTLENSDITTIFVTRCLCDPYHIHSGVNVF
jgi:hypothetical protein